jgi:hypothetical protein
VIPSWFVQSVNAKAVHPGYSLVAAAFVCAALAGIAWLVASAGGGSDAAFAAVIAGVFFGVVAAWLFTAALAHVAAQWLHLDTSSRGRRALVLLVSLPVLFGALALVMGRR